MSIRNQGKDHVQMHKPKRKSKYWEQFSYEYDGVTYSGKKNCCEKLGLRYLGVLQHAHDYNCTFEEAISQMLENKQKKELFFVIGNGLA